MKKAKKSLPLLGILLFIFIISRINFSYYLNEIPPVKWWLILFSALLMGAIIAIKIWRWQIILKRQGINYNFKKASKLYLIGFYLGAITPSRIGELGKIYYLKKDQHSLANSSIVTILDKIIDIVFVLVFGLIGLVSYYQYFQFNKYLIGSCLLTIVGLLISYYLTKNYWPKFYESLIKIKQKIKSTLSNYRLIDHLAIWILTIISWLIYFLMAYLLGRSVGITKINFWYVALITNLASLASILPISIMGLGTRESIFIFFYLLRGVPKEIAVAVSMLIFIISLLPIIVGFIIWLTNKQTTKLDQPIIKSD